MLRYSHWVRILCCLPSSVSRCCRPTNRISTVPFENQSPLTASRSSASGAQCILHSHSFLFLFFFGTHGTWRTIVSRFLFTLVFFPLFIWNSWDLAYYCLFTLYSRSFSSLFFFFCSWDLAYYSRDFTYDCLFVESTFRTSTLRVV
ncbi:hypothetical protein EDB85DRAFT_1155089 [Lactarius pseudohatsudake]|nr:hypothetical protein EDB85DRAFT_1155089 [Lactarius pseudohatsudake]